MQFRVFCPFSKIKNVFSYFSFAFFTVSLAPKLKMLPFFIKVSFSINDHKMKKSTNQAHQPTLHPQKLTIDLLFKNNRTHDEFQGLILSPRGRRRCLVPLREWKDGRFEILNFSFLSTTRFFYLSRKMLL